MGYMGLGLQKWIYTMRPRKPYSMERKGSFTKVPTYHRTFKLQPSKKSSDYYITYVILIVFSFFVIQAYPSFMSYSREHHKMQIEYEINKKDTAFNFLMTSGKNRLSNQNITGAYSEFVLAKAIYSDNTEINNLLIETLTILCFKDDSYCDELDRF